MNSGFFNAGANPIGGIEGTSRPRQASHAGPLRARRSHRHRLRNGTDDFKRINGIPAAVINIPVGHGGTYFEPNGGLAAQIVTSWLDWQLKGSKEARRALHGSDLRLLLGQPVHRGAKESRCPRKPKLPANTPVSKPFGDMASARNRARRMTIASQLESNGAVDLGPLDALVGYHLRRAPAAVGSDYFRSAEPNAMRQVQFGVLSVISANPGINQASVGRALGIAKPNMVALVNELIDRDWVDRSRRCRRSARIVLNLTPAEKGGRGRARAHPRA